VVARPLGELREELAGVGAQLVHGELVVEVQDENARVNRGEIVVMSSEPRVGVRTAHLVRPRIGTRLESAGRRLAADGCEQIALGPPAAEGERRADGCACHLEPDTHATAPIYSAKKPAG
jgi:hypothetical protein